MAPPSAQQLEQTLQMLENPQMAQMMEGFLSNPTMMQNIMASNPMMQQMMQQNPQAARMLQDPQVLRSMMQPDNLRAMMQLQQSMGGGFPPGGGWMMPSPMDQNGVGAFGMPPSPSSPVGLDFSSLLNQMQQTSLGSTPFTTTGTQQQQQHPSDRFRIQLQSLRDMGFDDEQTSLRAIMASHGNLNRAVDMLLMGEVPPPDGTSTIPNNGALGGVPPAAPVASVVDEPVSLSSSEPSTATDDDNEVDDQPLSSPKKSNEKKND
jgi:ubiquilin